METDTYNSGCVKMSVKMEDLGGGEVCVLLCTLGGNFFPYYCEPSGKCKKNVRPAWFSELT